MAEKIIIDSVAPEGSGDDLKGCYYKARNDGTFDFFDKDNKVKARDLRQGSQFSFDLDEAPGIYWTLTITDISETNVTGDWSDGPEEEPDGTYQGQAGGGADAESAASASGV